MVTLLEARAALLTVPSFAVTEQATTSPLLHHVLPRVLVVAATSTPSTVQA